MRSPFTHPQLPCLHRACKVNKQDHPIWLRSPLERQSFLSMRLRPGEITSSFYLCTVIMTLFPEYTLGAPGFKNKKGYVEAFCSGRRSAWGRGYPRWVCSSKSGEAALSVFRRLAMNE